MKEFMDILCNRWNDFTDEEKDVISNFIMIKKQSVLKDEDIILVKPPLNKDTGHPLMDYDTLVIYHNIIKDIFKNNTVLTIPLDIEIISKLD